MWLESYLNYELFTFLEKEAKAPLKSKEYIQRE